MRNLSKLTHGVNTPTAVTSVNSRKNPRHLQSYEGRFTKRVHGLIRFIPKAHLRDTYLVMQETMCLERRTSFDGIEQIADRRGVDARTIRRHLVELIALGVVIRDLRRYSLHSNATNRYTFPLLNEDFLRLRRKGCGRYRGEIAPSSEGSQSSYSPEGTSTEVDGAGLAAALENRASSVSEGDDANVRVIPKPEIEIQTTTAREARAVSRDWKPDRETYRKRPPTAGSRMTFLQAWRLKCEKQRPSDAWMTYQGTETPDDAPEWVELRAKFRDQERERRKRRVDAR